MRKLFPTVAAFISLYILLGPSAVQSQGPAAAKGPDAALAALVNTACTSCHAMDRVNNKKGDIAAWTTTVTRMKGIGAALTDEQVPQVVDYLFRNAGTFAVSALDGAAKGKGGPPGGAGAAKGKGGGGGGRNIQVLQGADIPATMQSFVQALGLLDKGTCDYCHVEDRSSDAKPQKVTARRMVIMMRAINGTFADGKQHVTCYTCHRGSPTPLTTAP
jgi:nitrate/TMAO reductase-like tetraheme cytochrome c subunit